MQSLASSLQPISYTPPTTRQLIQQIFQSQELLYSPVLYKVLIGKQPTVNHIANRRKSIRIVICTTGGL